MELKEIAVVSGKPGLFKIVKPAKTGVILEPLDGSTARFIAGASTKVSVLGEISIYTESGNNVALEEVFKTIYSKFGKSLPIAGKASDTELRSFFDQIVSDHDKQKVYTSDIKKVLTWYSVLLNAGFEETFSSQTKVEEAVVEPKKEKKSKKETPAEEELAEAPKKTVTAPAAKKVEKPEVEEKASAPKSPSKKSTK